MTRDQVMALTYPLPLQLGDREQHLRAVVWYDNPPPQIAFDGPHDAEDLRRATKWRTHWREDVQWVVEAGEIRGAEVELQERAIMQHLDALDKAILMAEAGWKIYVYDLFIAVLVREE